MKERRVRHWEGAAEKGETFGREWRERHGET